MRSISKQSRLLKNVIIITIIILYLFKIILLFKNYVILWDEAVYLSIGKYFFSFSTIGLFESIRPPIMPLLFGSFWYFGLNQIIFSRIIEIIFSIGLVFFTYKLTNKIFDQNHAIISAFILSITPVFFIYSSLLLTEIPSTFFGIIAFYTFINKRYFYSGIFSGIAFLTRFPQGLIAASIILLIILNEKEISKIIKSLFRFSFGLIIITLPYIIFNYLLYNKYNDVLSALLRPIISALKSQNNPYETISYEFINNISYYFIYLIKENPILIMLFLGIFLFFKNKYYLDSKKNTILITLFIILTYHVIILNKQARFTILFLPYFAIITSIGITYLINNFYYKRIIISIIIGLLIMPIVINTNNFISNYNSKPSEYQNYYLFFKDKEINGSILTSDPVPAAYIDKRFIKFVPHYSNYEGLLPSNEWERNEKIGAIIFTSNSFPCIKEDIECEIERNKLMQELSKNKLIFNETYFGQQHLIFIST